jgi:transcriptional regulator with XRE-family HTH domain
MEELQKALGIELRTLRRKLHIDQETLASKVGVTRSSISNIESSRQAVSLEMFIKLAAALNQDPAVLLNTIRNEASVIVSRDDVDNEAVFTTIQTTLSKLTNDK